MNGNGRRESNALQVDVDDDYVSNYSNIQVVSTDFFFGFVSILMNRQLKDFVLNRDIVSNGV